MGKAHTECGTTGSLIENMGGKGKRRQETGKILNVEVNKKNMNVSKKALSLLLSISMVVTSFVGTGVFAADGGNAACDSNFDSGTYYHFHITDSQSQEGAVTLTGVEQGAPNNYYAIPTEVDSQENGTYTYKVNAVDHDAFANAGASEISYGEYFAKTDNMVGGSVGIYKDSANNDVYAVAFPDDGYRVNKWLDNTYGNEITDQYKQISGKDFSGIKLTAGEEVAVTFTNLIETRDFDERDNYAEIEAGRYQFNYAGKSGLTWSIVKDANGKELTSAQGVLSISGDIITVNSNKVGERVLLQAVDPEDSTKVYFVRVEVSGNQPELSLQPKSGPLDAPLFVGDSTDFTVSTNDQSTPDYTVTFNGSKTSKYLKVTKQDKTGFTVTAVSGIPNVPVTVTIVVSAKNYQPSRWNRVTVLYRGLTINGTSFFYPNPDTSSATFTAAASDTGALVSDVTWSSSNDSVASVAADGKVTAKAVGWTVIKATSVSSGYVGRKTVYVGDSAMAPFSYSFDNGDYTDVPADQLSIDGILYQNEDNDDAPDLGPVVQEGYYYDNDLGFSSGTNFNVKLPVKSDGYSFSAAASGEKEHGSTSTYDYKKVILSKDVTVSSADSGNSTIITIPVSEFSSYPDLSIYARPKSGITYEWSVSVGGECTDDPQKWNFDRAGTYTYTAASGKTFTFSDDGTFYLGTDKQVVKNQIITDRYNLSYQETLVYSFDDTPFVKEIRAEVPKANPTESWVWTGEDTDYYDWQYDDSNGPAFVDYENCTDGSNNDVYTLNGNSPTPSHPTDNGGSSTTTVTTPTSPETAAPGTTTTTQSPTGAATVTYVTVASAPVVNGSTCSVSTSVPADAAAAAAAAGTAAHPATLAVQLPVSALVAQLAAPVQTVALSVSAPTSVVYGTASNVVVSIPLDSTVLQAAQAAKKDLKVTVLDAATGLPAYTWTFTGASLAGATALTSINLAMRTLTTTLDAGVSGALPTAVHGAVLAFANNGELPGRASVSVYVGDQGFVPGQQAFLYYYNEETGALETTDNPPIIIDAQGDAQIGVTHNSKYVLLPKQVAAVTPIKLDTGKKLSVKASQSYLFKVTASQKPTFASGNNAVFTASLVGSKGNNYFFKVTAVGKVGSSTGFYVNDEKKPRTVATIVK